MRPQPLITCRDVEAASRWYQRLLGCRSAHGGPDYERLVDPARQRSDEGTDGLILQLHHREVEHHHGAIGDPDARTHGNGVLLWFEVDDLDRAAARAAELGAEVVMPLHRNPPEGPGGPAHRELWIRDLDGYTVVLASPDGEAA
jgi:catechol 2,3-dioxygenase-like lactoylglutathione lyase family enzyme